MNKTVQNLKGVIKILPILFIVITGGLIAFLAISSIGPFRGFFENLFPKPPSEAATQAILFVSPAGSGTICSQISPCSLFGARDKIRTINTSMTGDIIVNLRGGTYFLTQSFNLQPADSGTNNFRVIYQSYPGENARLIGGKALDPGGWSLVSSSDGVWNRLDPLSRGQVYKISLPAQGLATGSYGDLTTRGLGWNSPFYRGYQGTLELFYNGAAMDLSRWPNRGENGSGIYGGFSLVPTFAALSSQTVPYSGTRPTRWSTATDLWIHSYTTAWDPRHVPISTDFSGNLFHTRPGGDQFGIGYFQHDIEANVPYYVENLLEELTAAGEWYLDRPSGTLYFWPPSALSNGEAIVSTLGAPVVVLTGASFITLKDLTIDVSKTQLLNMDAASHDNLITGSLLRNAGASAVMLNGRNNKLDQSEVSGSGDMGIEINGGNMTDLTPGNNAVTNSEIHHNGRWSWTASPAVWIQGVGNTVSKNHLHHGPSQGVWFRGNNLLIELNEIDHFVQMGGDMGALWASFSWSQRGSQVRYNYIHDIGGWFSSPPATITSNYGQHGIYLDYLHSGNWLHGNIIDKTAGFCIQHNGGRDVLVENNLLMNCGSGIGSNTFASSAAYALNKCESWNDPNQINASLKDRNAVWNAPFPLVWTLGSGLTTNVYQKFAAMPDPVVQGTEWCTPGGSVFSRNLSFNNGTYILNANVMDIGPTAIGKFLEHINNITGDPQFVDPADIKKGLKSSSPALSIPNWQTIPFNQIGPGSQSPLPTSTPSPTSSPSNCQGADLDTDRDVDIFDYNILVGNFGKSGVNIPGDIDRDGDVDIFDYNILVGNFSKTGC